MVQVRFPTYCLRRVSAAHFLAVSELATTWRQVLFLLGGGLVGVGACSGRAWDESDVLFTAVFHRAGHWCLVRHGGQISHWEKLWNVEHFLLKTALFEDLWTSQNVEINRNVENLYELLGQYLACMQPLGNPPKPHFYCFLERIRVSSAVPFRVQPLGPTQCFLTRFFKACSILECVCLLFLCVCLIESNLRRIDFINYSSFANIGLTFIMFHVIILLIIILWLFITVSIMQLPILRLFSYESKQ